jgi:hypothetical protein
MYEEKNGLNRERAMGKPVFIQKRMKNCLLFGLLNGREEEEEEEKKREKSKRKENSGKRCCNFLW